MTRANDAPVKGDSSTAFGDDGTLGIRRIGGESPIDEFTTEQWVSVRRRARQFPV